MADHQLLPPAIAEVVGAAVEAVAPESGVVVDGVVPVVAAGVVDGARYAVAAILACRCERSLPPGTSDTPSIVSRRPRTAMALPSGRTKS